MLGHRGCRLGITYPEITEMQARAIFEAVVQVAKKGKTVIPEVMIPLVGFVKEFRDQKAIAERGLADLAEVRFLDYRDVPESNFDAVSSIGLTEHIGHRNYPAYFTRLSEKLRPGGRLLNHCITRATTQEKARAGGFIDRYVFPDGELVALNETLRAAELAENRNDLGLL